MFTIFSVKILASLSAENGTAADSNNAEIYDLSDMLDMISMRTEAQMFNTTDGRVFVHLQLSETVQISGILLQTDLSDSDYHLCPNV